MNSVDDIQCLGEILSQLKQLSVWEDRDRYDPVRLQVEVALEACRHARSRLQAELALQDVEVIE